METIIVAHLIGVPVVAFIGGLIGWALATVRERLKKL